MKCDKHAKNEEIRKGAIQERTAVCFLIASEIKGRSKVLTGDKSRRLARALGLSGQALTNIGI